MTKHKHHDLPESEAENRGSTASLHQKLNIETDALLEHPSYLELQKKLNEMEEKEAQARDQLLRLGAEKDNMDRRYKRELENAHKYAISDFVTALLPIIDSLEMALSHSAEDKSVLEGVELTLKMFYAAIEKFGLKQVDPLNEPFNPEWHQAVKAEVNDRVSPNTVIQVLQKGYLLNNRLVRPAMVIVSKAS